MAMLAEPRRRQKWTLNPRGKQWSEDTNKFGQKMLEKMGWSSGKGLGANEQGMTDHVRVSFKNDNAGFGFKNDGMDKAWTEHQDGFNDLLKELQSTQETTETLIVETKHETLSGKSLELKSKQSRARVHYQKFTRGKDVNKYSSKDLANIFGQKDLTATNSVIEEKVEEEVEDFCPDPVGTQDTTGGVLTIKSGSISDYLKHKGSGIYKPPENSKRLTDSEDEPMYAGFGFSPSQNKKESTSEDVGGICNYGFISPDSKGDSLGQIESPVVKSKKSKKKRKSTFYDEELNDSTNKVKDDLDSANDGMNGFINPGLNLTNETEETQNGNEFEVSRAEFGLTNTAFDPEDENKNKRRVTFNDRVEYSTDAIKKKKGKATLDKFEVENKKHKRKRKLEESVSDSTPISFVNEALDCEDKPEEVVDNEINERKNRKAKRRRPSILETIVETPEEEKTETVELDNNKVADGGVGNQESTEKDGKKKKKKKKKEKVTSEDTIKEENVSIDNVQHIDCTPKKKKKMEATVQMDEQVSENSEPKKKKKRKHSENTENFAYAINEHPNELEVIPEQSNPKDEDKSTNTNDTIESPARKKKDKKSKREAAKCEVETVEDSPKIEKEVSDKENSETGEGDSAKSKKKKRKKDKRKSMENATDVNMESNAIESMERTEQIIQEKVDSNFMDNNWGLKAPRSPWSQRARMSKKLLQSFFHRNAISNFPGSNIYEIEGYGTKI